MSYTPTTGCKWYLSPLPKVMLGLTIAAFFLFENALHQSGLFRELETALLSFQSMLLICFVVWCGTVLILRFSLKDLPLIGLILIVISLYFISYKEGFWTINAMVLLASVTLGKIMMSLLTDERVKMEKCRTSSKAGSHEKEVEYLLIGLAMLLTFASWSHLSMMSAYHGPRWMGLWDNPNVYGMLMGSGTTLAVALQGLSLKSKAQSPKLDTAKTIGLSVAIFMMALGLAMSYSRGAWLGTVVGLFYLAWSYGKLNRRYVVTGLGFVALGILLFWNRTPDSSAWYVKRMDFGRPSAQHRVAAWKAGFEIMLDHPFGVGWNKAVETYEKHYSPPAGGASALTMNSYLMLGTELGLPALLCFIAYIYLKFKPRTDDPLQVACRASTLVLLVAFWFDGGLFDLPTATLFWILLELSQRDLTAIAAKSL